MLSSVSTATERTTVWPVLAGGPQFVAIDSNGNLTSKVDDGHTWTYEWNAENELKRVLKDSAEVARYSYDPKGRRVEKVAGGLTTGYVYDAEDVLKQVAGASSVRYIHGLGADEPLATENGAGQLTYEHADGLGSEVKQTDGAGAVTFSRSYDAFGQLQAGATAPGYAFTGREWDPETGLYYYRARYYDARAGRFLTEDPIGFDGGINFYAYVDGDPIGSADPSGLASVVVNPATIVPVSPPTWACTTSPWGCATPVSTVSAECTGCGVLKITITIDPQIRVRAGRRYKFPKVKLCVGCRPADPRVRGQKSATQHEMDHINDVASDLTNYATAWEQNYGSMEACQQAKEHFENSFPNVLKLFAQKTQTARD